MKRYDAYFSGRLPAMFVIVFFALARAGAAQEKRRGENCGTSQNATIYPVPNYGGDFWSRSYLQGIGAGSDRSWRTMACSSILT